MPTWMITIKAAIKQANDALYLIFKACVLGTAEFSPGAEITPEWC
jgi:hypothetical protein